jgi:hypothetical protein
MFLDQRKECLLLALQHHFQQHLVSHPGTDQDQPCLASEASQQWYGGWLPRSGWFPCLPTSSDMDGRWILTCITGDLAALRTITCLENAILYWTDMSLTGRHAGRHKHTHTHTYRNTP